MWRNCQRVRLSVGFLLLTTMARPSQDPRGEEADCRDGIVAREGRSSGTLSASPRSNTPATFTAASVQSARVVEAGKGLIGELVNKCSPETSGQNRRTARCVPSLN